ncbi:hypothetical protein ACIBJI_40255, partial [Nocardia sp. NPDC050408]|uniref:hypothetical protein n=1 Tax=Nocardia sp. NPDC050408 TaxID=3364319 RepID=UPI00378D66C9
EHEPETHTAETEFGPPICEFTRIERHRVATAIQDAASAPICPAAKSVDPTLDGYWPENASFEDALNWARDEDAERKRHPFLVHFEYLTDVLWDFGSIRARSSATDLTWPLSRHGRMRAHANPHE